MTTGTVPSGKKHRSPSYPSIDLGTAIERCNVLWSAIRRGSTGSASALGYWGYSPKSSGGKTTLAALRKFGLVDVKKGKVSLSPLAFSIILDERDNSQERAESLKEAALLPAIHEEMWAKWGSELPDDAHIRHFLRVEREFNDSAIPDVIDEYKSTLSFANLAHKPQSEDEFEDSSEDIREDGMEPLVKESPGTSVVDPKNFQFTVTLYGGHLATVKAPVPMTKRNLERLKRMIEDQLEPFVDVDGPEVS